MTHEQPKKNEHGVYNKDDAEKIIIKINKDATLEIYILKINNGYSWAITTNSKIWGYSTPITDREIKKTRINAIQTAQEFINRITKYNDKEKNKITAAFTEIIDEKKQGELF